LSVQEVRVALHPLKHEPRVAITDDLGEPAREASDDDGARAAVRLHAADAAGGT
jgi:hypothetical protein